MPVLLNLIYEGSKSTREYLEFEIPVIVAEVLLVKPYTVSPI
jgi:hypothetical protein